MSGAGARYHYHGDDFADRRHRRDFDDRDSARAPQLRRAEGLRAEGPRPGGGGARDVGRGAAAQRPRLGSIEWLDSKQRERHETLYHEIAAVRYEVQQLGGKVEARDNRVQELEHQVQELEHEVEARNNQVQELDCEVQEHKRNYETIKRENSNIKRQRTEADQEKKKCLSVIAQMLMMFSGYSGLILDVRVYGKDTFALAGEVIGNGGNGDLRRGVYVCHDHKEDTLSNISVYPGCIKRFWSGSKPPLWHLSQKIVIKTAKDTVPGLESFKREQDINKRLMENNVKGVPKSQYYDEEDVLVMEDCGQNFEEKYIGSSQQLELKDVCKYGRMILAIIGDIHALGILHMDLKPANLTMKDGKIYIIDFGEALSEWKGNIRKGWCGTYRSVNLSRNNREIGKVDDLWSVYFILLSLIRPDIIVDWKRIKRKHGTNGKHKQLEVKETFIRSNKANCTILQLLADEHKTDEEKFVGFQEQLTSNLNLTIPSVFQF